VYGSRRLLLDMICSMVHGREPFISDDVSGLFIYNRFSGTCCSSVNLFLYDLVPHRFLSVMPRGPLLCSHGITTHRMLRNASFPISAGWVRVYDVRIHRYSHYLGRRCRKTHGIILPMTCRICERCTREASRSILFENRSDIEESPYTLYVHYNNHLTWVFEQVSFLEIYLTQYHPGTSFLI